MGDTSKQFSLQNFRPEGFQYPVGLTSNPSANGGGPGTGVVFTSTPGPGSYTLPLGIWPEIDVLVVAGGGGGGGDAGGAGGAGGLVYGSGYPITPGESVTVTIGAGGSAGTYNPPSFSETGNGTNSVFKTITAVGGGGGAHYNGSSWQPAKAGGSGGGAARQATGPGAPGTQSPSGGLTGYGNPGGACPGPGGGSGGGGGGGAGGAGEPKATNRGANGGIGLTFTISGSSVGYAGGGASTTDGIPGAPAGVATDGGGAGTNGGAGIAGTSNRGGGGGVGSFPANDRSGGAGGSGVVIIRYYSPAYFIN